MEYQILILGLCVVAWKDAMLKQIPNQMLLILLLVRFVLLISDRSKTIEAIEGFLIGGGVMLLGYLLSKSTMGAGDVKLMAVVGSYVGGERILQVTLWSFATATGFGVIQALRKRNGICQEIPLAPFVLLGTILTFYLETRGVLC